jgi:hypothetical protein
MHTLGTWVDSLRYSVLLWWGAQFGEGMSVPEVVHRLVDRFHSNLDAYKSGAFSEAQVRIDFINPLLGEALG